MTITVEKTLLNNQSTLENFAFGEELDTEFAEIISGGRYNGRRRFRRRNRGLVNNSYNSYCYAPISSSSDWYPQDGDWEEDGTYSIC